MFQSPPLIHASKRRVATAAAAFLSSMGGEISGYKYEQRPEWKSAKACAVFIGDPLHLPHLRERGGEQKDQVAPV